MYDNEFPVVCNKIDHAMLLNMMKYVDIRLLEPMNGITVSIFLHYGEELHIFYRSTNKQISINITNNYIMVNADKNSTLMYDGDGEETPVKERLFDMVMDLINNTLLADKQA